MYMFAITDGHDYPLLLGNNSQFPEDVTSLEALVALCTLIWVK